MKHILVIFGMFWPRLKSILKGALHFLVSATEVPKIVQLVFNMELLAISSMSEFRCEHKVCFVAF